MSKYKKSIDKILRQKAAGGGIMGKDGRKRFFLGGGGNDSYDIGGGGDPGNTTNNNNNDNQNTGNDNNDMQNYMSDQTTYTANNTPTNTTISDQDAKDFFDARPDYKAAADQAAKKKAEQQAKAKKEKDRIDAILAEHKNKEPVAYSYGKPIKNYKKNYFTGPNKFSTATKMRQLALKNLIDKKMGNKNNLPSIFKMGNLFNPSMVDQDYTYNSGITTDMMGIGLTPKQQAERLQNYSDISDYGMTGKNLTDIDRMNRALDTGRETGEITQQQFENAFNNQNINPIDGGNNQPFIPINYNTGAAEEQDDPYTNDYTYRFGDTQKVGADVTRGYAADGGIMGTRARKAFGGIMDRVTGRKAYGLGSIFKSIAKPFKSVAKAAGKVLKSDIGKMALLAGAYYYGGGALPGIGARTGASGFGTTGRFGLSKLRGAVQGSDFLSKALMNKNSNFSPFKVAGLFATAAPFLGIGTKTKPNETSFSERGGPLLNSQGDGSQGSIAQEIQAAYAAGDSERIAELQKYYNYMLPSQDAVQDLSLPSSLPYPNYAEGGRIGKAEGGLLDMGGMEKDYRNDGGFVPIGEYEKKDDVPARLSVNEFVFTADAVRGAGGGDIDKGAEIMENVMKNLEGGGQMSKESQGNTGAQEMFSVSQRLGEVL